MSTMLTYADEHHMFRLAMALDMCAADNQIPVAFDRITESRLHMFGVERTVNIHA